MGTIRYKRDLKEMEARRRRGMRMLKRGIAQADIARELEVSRQTVSTWNKALAEDPQAWKRRPLGRPGALSMSDKKKLAKLLISGAVAADFPTELWTLKRIRVLIQREFGLAYSQTHTWRLLKEMGFSSQRPAGRATQRDETAIVEWKAKRWPMLKKKPAASSAPSSSSTNLD